MNLQTVAQRLVAVLTRLQGWLEAVRVRVQPHVERWLADWKENPDNREADFVQDADHFMIHQEPLRARILIKTILIAGALFIMWSAVALVDERIRQDEQCGGWPHEVRAHRSSCLGGRERESAVVAEASHGTQDQVDRAEEIMC